MPTTKALQFWPVTDVGRVRNHNEDSFLVDETLGLAVVADGMGGHAAGEVASSIAVHTFRNTLIAEREKIDALEKGMSAHAREAVLRLLEKAVQQACAAVFSEAQTDATKRGMGTTLVALLLAGSRGFVAHVGDSRIYLVRQGSVHQLTEDHSLINELLKRGRLTREQIEKLDYKNAVTRAVGVYESVEADTLDFDVLPGDRFLLCSDGLTSYTEIADLQEVFEQHADSEVAREFVDLANERGGNDNITAVVVRVPETAGMEVLAQEVNLKLEVLHRMPLFRFLTYQELVRVMNLTEVQSFKDGDPVVSEGEHGDELFIVLRGQVRVHSGDTTLTTLDQGQHFGEMALVDKAPRSASVSSQGESRLIIMRRRHFFDIIRKDHDVAVKLLWSFLGVLTERLRNTSRELGDARERLTMQELSDQLLSDADPEE